MIVKNAYKEKSEWCGMHLCLATIHWTSSFAHLETEIIWNDVQFWPDYTVKASDYQFSKGSSLTCVSFPLSLARSLSVSLSIGHFATSHIILSFSNKSDLSGWASLGRFPKGSSPFLMCDFSCDIAKRSKESSNKACMFPLYHLI